MIELNDIMGRPMVIKKQDRGLNCGQTAVSMLTGIQMDKVYKAFGTKSVTNMQLTVSALRKLGVQCSDFAAANGEPMPEYALARIAFYKRSGGHQSNTKFKRLGHLVVVVKGIVVDPNGDVYPLSTLKTHRNAGVTHYIKVEPKNAPTAEMVSEGNWLW